MGERPKMAAHCLIVLVLAATITTTIGQEAPATGKPASPAAREFLKECCRRTGSPDTCFTGLLPYAESFQGSRTKVTIAGTTILMAKLDSLLAEMHGVKIESPGQYKLDDCIKAVEALTAGKRERLAKFKALEAIGDTKLTDKDTAEVDNWVKDVDKGIVMDCNVDVSKMASYVSVMQFIQIAQSFLVVLKEGTKKV
ncbi:hypothetical protein ACP70R_003069 [Stipagrostis hirtigluma subsp. patula]